MDPGEEIQQGGGRGSKRGKELIGFISTGERWRTRLKEDNSLEPVPLKGCTLLKGGLSMRGGGVRKERGL